MEISTVFKSQILNILQDAGKDIPTQAKLEAMPGILQRKATDIRDAVVAAGDEFHEAQQWSSTEHPDEAISLFYHFEFADRAKQLLLFWRDVLFQHLKGKLLIADGKLTEAHLLQHWEHSAEAGAAAIAQLTNWTELKMADLKSKNPVATKNLENWKLQNNPWPVFKEQLNTICQQCGDLIENYEAAAAHQQVFLTINSLTLQTLELCAKETEKVSNFSKDTMEWLKSPAAESPGKVTSKLEQIEDNLNLGNHLEVFTQNLEEKAEGLPSKWQFVVGTNGGMLQRQELNLKRQVTLWLEGEVLPLFYEVWEQTETMHNSAKMSLSNMKNRAALMPVNTEENFDASVLGQPLFQYEGTLQRARQEIADLSEQIKAKVSEDFKLSNIYDISRPFLPLSMQRTVLQLEAKRGWLIDQLTKWFSGILPKLSRIWYNLEEEENLGISEKTIRYLEHRQPDPDSHHYTSIFLTKGFVGASFATGREATMARFGNIVRNWENGYRGAVLLTGRRFCGKSFFGEWAATRFFPGNIIRLTAKQDINYKGRKLTGGTNLEEALDFVKKYTLNDRPLVWIDDLELWQDTENTLVDNVDALLHFNDHYATRCFVLASTNRWIHRHLDALLRIDRGFQTTLHFDTMPLQEIAKAILIRHGATHKSLVTADGKELSARQVQKHIIQVAKAAHGNIGEALQWWSASVHPAGEDAVTINFSDRYGLPSNFSQDMSLLLYEILLQKRTDEYRLRKQFGQAFNKRYADLTRRLLGTGLLTRLPDGSLEITENAVNAVAGRIVNES